MSSGWIGVDLDGTLAEYNKFQGAVHIGAPILSMVDRVKGWLREGREVRIFTARVSHDGTEAQIKAARAAELAIAGWCQLHLGALLPVTCVKDYHMVELWDDRCVQVESNTGRVLGRSRVK